MCVRRTSTDPQDVNLKVPSPAEGHYYSEFCFSTGWPETVAEEKKTLVSVVPVLTVIVVIAHQQPHNSFKEFGGYP